MVNILIDHNDKDKFDKDIEAIKEVFNILEITDIKKYKDKYYIEIDVISKDR